MVDLVALVAKELGGVLLTARRSTRGGLVLGPDLHGVVHHVGRFAKVKEALLEGNWRVNRRRKVGRSVTVRGLLLLRSARRMARGTWRVATVCKVRKEVKGGW